ncbi:MAG: NADH-quinone oxidoreductase subunit J [Magnetococcales bacterium]|nr:NADH-quinone oxidoreductase subunit J [Magnetococcales bacterium]
MNVLADLLFYLFSAVLVMAALGVVTVRNPVHSVLLLVLAFFSSSALFVLLGAEFLAAILVMVYMGAVAMLFLFVVMMLDIDFDTLRRGMREHLPLGIAIGGLLMLELVVLVSGIHLNAPQAAAGLVQDNVREIGRVLYTTYLYPFEIASVILLVALIGAVTLTARKRSDQKHQNICQQLARTRDQAVELKKMAPGEGA